MIVDVVALSSGWLIGLSLGAEAWSGRRIAGAAAALLLTVVLMATNGMYRRHIASVRTAEIAGTVRSVWVASLAVALGFAVLEVIYGVRMAFISAAINTVVIIVTRGIFRYWLMRRRAAGHYRQRVIFVGVHSSGDEWFRRFHEHQELGLDVVGVCGGTDGGSVELAGEAQEDDPVRMARSRDASCAIVVAAAFRSDELSTVLRRLDKANLYIQLTSPGGNLLVSRMKLQSLVNQPVFFIAPIRTPTPLRRLKRVVDVCLASALLALLLPVILIAAIGIKLTDGGPVMFRQTRVGRGGRPFEMLKLRSMVVDAEDRLAAIRDEHGSERSGPLFKLEDDPRFTRVGRFLDRTSLNELPQLWNVIKGDMSLVGPRPALPDEHDAFDEELRRRVSVRPGLSGLWQIEAREAPSFESYRRLDLQYVDNWSLTLDFVILVATFETVLGRFMLPNVVSDAVSGAEVADLRRAG